MRILLTQLDLDYGFEPFCQRQRTPPPPHTSLEWYGTIQFEHSLHALIFYFT